MQVRFNCPTEGCVALIELEPLEGCGGSIRCPRCRREHKVALSDAVVRDGRVDRCPLCGCRELFIRRDFPQKLGLLIVVGAALLSLLTYKGNILVSWGVLGAAVGVDLIIYMLVGTVTACYACRAEFRKVAPNPEHEGFDLARSEKY